MVQRPENLKQRFLNARNDAPIGSKIAGVLGFGALGYFGGHLLIDTNPSLSIPVLTGHTADVFGTTAMMFVMSSFTPERARLWQMGAVMFSILGGREVLQGALNTGGFDVYDFAAYAAGIGLWAGTDRLAKRRR